MSDVAARVSHQGRVAAMTAAILRSLTRFFNKSGSQGVLFADERAKLAWETGQAVSRISATLAPESHSLQAIPITFVPEHASQGRYAILMAGTVIGTPQRDVYLVPERSLKILQHLKIRYRVVELPSPHPVLG